jgi:hypothetical protein
MVRRLHLLGVSAALLASVGSASAASILEDVSIISNSNTSFVLADLSFSSPGGSNIFAGSKYATSGGASVPTGSLTLLDDKLFLDSAQTYTVSFDLNSHQESASLIPSTSSQTVGGFTVSGLSFTAVGATVSPVPLPASMPLFILALVSLAAFGYHTRRKTARLAT